MSRRYLLYGSERYALAILRPLQEAIRARSDEAAWYFDGPGAADLVPAEQNLQNVRAVMDWAPDAVITPSNAVPHFFPGLKVGIFHGFDAGKPRHIYVRGFFDLYCTTGPQDTAAFETLARELNHFAVRETGWPKLDPYLQARNGDPPAPVKNPPVVLYHSTFSPSWSAAEILHDSVRDLAASGRWRWIVTLHPKMRPEVVARYRALAGPYLRYADNDNILDLFDEADVMVSDTSSALHEFLVTRKPVVTFRNRRPGPQLINIETTAQLEPAIMQALSRPVALMEEIARYAASLHPYDDGRSSERVLAVVDEFLDAQPVRLAPKPLNVWRKLKIRRRVGYWGRA